MTTDATGKRPLLLLSGGLDSTYILFKYPTADTIRVEVKNSWEKVKREQEAVQRVREYINHRNLGKDQGRHDVKEYTIEGRNFGFTQMPVWFIKLFEASHPDCHTSAMVGYCDGDQAAESIAWLVTAWDALWRAVRPGAEIVPLYFPASKITKVQMLQEMPDELIKLTWSCEALYGTEAGECGQCFPCHRKLFEYIRAKKTHLLPDSLFIPATKQFFHRDLVDRLNGALVSDYTSENASPEVVLGKMASGETYQKDSNEHTRTSESVCGSSEPDGNQLQSVPAIG